MVIIDFEKIVLWADIAHTVQVVKDIKKDVAEGMYKSGHGIAYHALALKIWNSKGETEYTDEEYKLIMDFVNEAGTPVFIDALMALGKEKA